MEYQEESVVLETEYRALAQPLFEGRREITTGSPNADNDPCSPLEQSGEIESRNNWFSNRELRKEYTHPRTADSEDEEAVVEDIYASDFFLSLFEAPVKPEEGDDGEEMRRLQWLLELDFDYGEAFKDKVIPYALHWYTREATLYEDDEDESDEDGEGDEGDQGSSEEGDEDEASDGDDTDGD
ncbi:hypothetical protein B0T14DRAFT_561831 [Immersiella caudata]|uniref:Uncharacterized protein n=1 Tax=Immersiella caudata TaxID=314043 RepID=A0AA39X2P6_9PEZI|nr:hypothetical protein B0T14DRAFT_561831 [Immersiella caudata]